MIKITRIETVYPAPEDDDDYCPDGESTSVEESVSFRELVDLMREHVYPSASHLRGTPEEWFSAEAYQDPYSGRWMHFSIHYSRDNPPRALKYWRAAINATHNLRSN